jgi:uroporphyrinogen-III synthase
LTTKIWITRTEPAATQSAEAWAKAGFDPVVAPLLTIESLEPKPTLPDKAVLIFTSAHGVLHSGLIGDDRRVYCVGDATARVAKRQGFSSVVSADGDWQKLTKTIEKTGAPVVHISGSVVRGEIVKTLRDQGFDARQHVVYQAKAATFWPIDVNQIDAVALYSPMASETLMALPPRHLFHLTAYCLSENVAAPLRDIGVQIAQAPNERALIACSETPEP